MVLILPVLGPHFEEQGFCREVELLGGNDLFLEHC